MIITIVEGSLKDYNTGNDNGSISFFETSVDESMNIARKFSDYYGKTVIIEPVKTGE